MKEKEYKEKPALAVDKDGNLQEVGKQIDVESFKELLEVQATPVNNWVFLQPLPTKEIKTNSGIVLSEGNKEFKCAIVAVCKDSQYKRGQVINLDQSMLPRDLAAVYYINNKPIMKVPEHLIIAVYDNIDLSQWKKEENS